jgi:hypothetical protein
MRLGIDSHAVPATVADGADGFESIKVKHQDLPAARDIEFAAVVVGVNIIDAARAHRL